MISSRYFQPKILYKPERMFLTQIYIYIINNKVMIILNFFLEIIH